VAWAKAIRPFGPGKAEPAADAGRPTAASTATRGKHRPTTDIRIPAS
jgi:hypothetical protein